MKGYHILLGEDEPDILEYNREQLEQRGYQVTAVSTLGQAESCVLRDNPDLLVLDTDKVGDYTLIHRERRWDLSN